MNKVEAEDFIYKSYLKAEKFIDYSDKDSSKRHPELTKNAIISRSKTPAVLVTGSKGKGSVAFSCELFARVRGTSLNSGETVYRYAVKNSFILIALTISSMIDAILNTLFADIFVFA